jgi:hypothetical protein
LYYENAAQSSGMEDGVLDAQVGGNHPAMSPQDPDFSRSGAPTTSSVLRASASGRIMPASLALEARSLAGETGDDDSAFELGNLGAADSSAASDAARFSQNV